MIRFSVSLRPPQAFAAAGSLIFALSGCQKPAPAAPPPQAMPVQVAPVSNSAVPSGDTYVATIKSRRSATMQPQVDGNLTRILVKSGDAVKAGQLLMTIDPLRQQATVEQQRGTEFQLKATLDYNKVEANRQRQLFEAGVISRDAYDIATQNLGNSTGAYDAAVQGTRSQQQQLAYYQIRAPFAGIIGDIPVHLGDYVSPTTLLTTVDEPRDLEAYIYLPTERASAIRTGLGVDIVDTAGATVTHSVIDFVSPQVDNGLQSVLAKASIPASTRFRTGQLVNAKVIFATNQVPTIPILAVSLIGGQTFAYVAAPKGGGYVAHQVTVKVGDPVGNVYPVLGGLNPGDKVILSGLQFLQEGVPVQPLSGPPPTAKS